MNDSRPNTKALRSFGFLMAGVLGCFSLVFVYKELKIPTLVSTIVAIAFLLPAVFAPARLEKVHAGWMKFAQVIGNFNAKLILGIIYILFITPARVGLMLMGKDPLKRKIEPSRKTYWVERHPQEKDPDRYQKQY